MLTGGKYGIERDQKKNSRYESAPELNRDVYR